MLKQIKSFFKKYNDMTDAIEYLANYISYHLMNSYKIKDSNKNFAIFGREQLAFLITSRIGSLTNKQVDQVINSALKNVSIKTKLSFMVNRNIIYLDLL